VPANSATLDNKFIAELAGGLDLWKGPLNLQDSTVYLKDGELLLINKSGTCLNFWKVWTARAFQSNGLTFLGKAQAFPKIPYYYVVLLF